MANSGLASSRCIGTPFFGSGVGLAFGARTATQGLTSGGALTRTMGCLWRMTWTGSTQIVFSSMWTRHWLLFVPVHSGGVPDLEKVGGTTAAALREEIEDVIVSHTTLVGDR